METGELKERAPRQPLDVRVNSSTFGFAQSKNISSTGIALLTEVPLKEGDFMQLQFLLPDSHKEINAYGKVVWSSAVSDSYYECGIQFWDIEDTDRKEIEDYFQNH